MILLMKGGDEVKGKKTDPATVFRVMVSWSTTDNYSQTARDLDVPVNTVRDIVKACKDLPEFVKLREQKREEFVEQATRIIIKGQELIERRLDRALEKEDEIDALIDTVFDADKEDISDTDKQAIAKKLRSLQLQDIKALATVMGTEYDKRALAKGESTNNVNLIGNDTIDKLASIAGYVKK